MHIKRNLKETLLERLETSRVVSIIGPRQSGKSTLIRNLVEEFGYTYINLENPETLLLIKEDIKSVLQLGSGKKFIVDEAQKFPELFSWIMLEVDKQNIPGQFILSGSQDFLLLKNIKQSLAGRVSILKLLPLSIQELDNVNLDKLMFSGLYPAVIAQNLEPSVYYSDYIATYLQRDVVELGKIGDFSLFFKFLTLLAGRSGQLLNKSSLASDVGINERTVTNWLSILYKLNICYSLEPYFENLGKRVIKSSKVYFIDTGLLCNLLRIKDSEQLSTHSLYGYIFENFVVNEILKSSLNKGINEQYYFYRDSHNSEIDLVIDNGDNKMLIEIKSAKTFSSDMIKTLVSNPFIKFKVKNYLIYQGDRVEVKNIDCLSLINFLDN